MPNAKFNLVQDNGDSQITLYHEGETHLADSSHPRWDDILRLVVVEDNPEDAVELFDVTRLLRRHVVSERVTVTYNVVLFDNDPVHDALADHIVRLVNEGEDVTAWVKLLENIKLNPNPESVEQLYRHLSTYHYTVTQTGMILAYKGVAIHRKEEGVYYSTRSGHAIVNGVEVNDYVAQKVGDVVEMPRSEVTFDPGVSCSYGLHVADWGYAKGMGSTVLAVLVNPRDVVSVPKDAGDAKVRVCRYKVLEVRTEPYSGAVLKTEVSISVTPEAKAEPEEVGFSNDSTRVPDEPVKAKDEGFQKGDRVQYFASNYTNHAKGTVLDASNPEDILVDWGVHGEIGYPANHLRLLTDDTTDDTSDSETKQETEVSATATPVRYRYPTQAKFAELVATAKRQKKGVRRFIEARTNWSLIEGRGDGTDRKDWSV